MPWNFQTFSCWLKLPNMAEWQFVFQMWDGVLPNPWDYEASRVPREMQVEHLFFLLHILSDYTYMAVRVGGLEVWQIRVMCKIDF
jgi:hypothetical protein